MSFGITNVFLSFLDFVGWGVNNIDVLSMGVLLEKVKALNEKIDALEKKTKDI